MDYIYVSALSWQSIANKLTDLFKESKTIFDRSTHTKYIRIGAGFDTETTKIKVDNPEVEYTAYCYHWQLGIHDTAFMGRDLDEFVEFIELLIERMKEVRPKTKLLIWDANLGYEWQFCKTYMAKIGITRVFAKERRKPLLIELSNLLEFREVIGLFGKSLAQIAKNYCGMEKLVGDLDYDVVRLSRTFMTDAEIGYCVRDVEILVNLAEKYIFKNFMGDNMKLPYTATGIVRNAIKREFGKGLKRQKELIKSWMPDDEFEYELFRRYLFKGGISGSNIRKMNTVLKHMRGADITSDYPFQMLTKKFPMGKAIVTYNGNFCKENIPYIAIIRFYKFHTRTQHALMSAHKVLNSNEMIRSRYTILDNNRIQYGEWVELVVNDVEYKSLKRAYKWKKAIVKKCWEFPEGYKLLPLEIRKICIKQYLIKESLKADHSETQEYRDAKAFVNSIFGMMCTALYFDDLIYIEEEGDIGQKDGEKRPYSECINDLFLSPYWGFWITSYAREMLIDVITRFPNVIVQYDTDSVYYEDGSEEAKALHSYLCNKNQQYRDMNDALFMHEEHMLSLGTWDFTDEFEKFKALGSKRYMYEDKNGKVKVVIAGCRKDSKGRSTLLNQCDYENTLYGKNISYFDFFDDKMVIDKEHSCKLASTYVDIPVLVDYVDCDGMHEVIKCPSSVVLEPIEFTMKMGETHKELMMAVQRFMRNCPTAKEDIRVVWEKYKELKI